VPTTGIISNGIDYFLFFFYSQVIGLSAALTGLALAIALTCDAVSNPMMGSYGIRRLIRIRNGFCSGTF